MKEQQTILSRPPIVTIMGHVDHGKTSLLDYLRHSNLAAKEFGAITQHTAAYQVTVNASKQERKLTLIDTPGHAAFSQMRMRGGTVADLVILVVAADDGVNKQTIEAIEVVNKAQVPVIVALTKTDLETADVKKVQEQLVRSGVQLEGWGGQVPSVPVSVKTGNGIQELLDLIFLTYDLNPPKAVEKNGLNAIVIESHKDSRQGSTAIIILLSGEIRVGDTLYTADGSFKVKSLRDDWGSIVLCGTAGDPIEILGMKEALKVGSHLSASAQTPAVTDGNNSNEAVAEDKEQIFLYVKADTLGTLEAVVANVASLSNEMCQVLVVGSGVGDVNENDILLASSSKAIIVGFNVNAHSQIKDLALQRKVIIRTYTLIYELLEDIEKMLQGITNQEHYTGKGLGMVIKLFPLASGDVVAGVLMTHGQIKEKDKIRILRGSDEIGRDIVKQLRVGSSRAKKVLPGNECGLLFRKGLALMVEDVIEVI